MQNNMLFNNSNMQAQLIDLFTSNNIWYKNSYEHLSLI